MTDNRLADLRRFIGSEQWFRQALNRAVLFTEGAKYVADQFGAYWLLDEIALAQCGVPAVKRKRSIRRFLLRMKARMDYVM